MTFPKALAVVLKHEGGWSDHPDDPGGATMKGVTLRTYSDWLGRPATKLELKEIPDEHLEVIYKNRYWNAVEGDELPYPLALMAFDAAVNSGPRRASIWLQQALEVNADGKIGPMTIKASHDCDIAETVRAYGDVRLAFLRGLPTWDTFGKGWESRVIHCMKEALA